VLELSEISRLLDGVQARGRCLRQHRAHRWPEVVLGRPAEPRCAQVTAALLSHAAEEIAQPSKSLVVANMAGDEECQGRWRQGWAACTDLGRWTQLLASAHVHHQGAAGVHARLRMLKPTCLLPLLLVQPEDIHRSLRSVVGQARAREQLGMHDDVAVRSVAVAASLAPGEARASATARVGRHRRV
jgi:hypothetical protein